MENESDTNISISSWKTEDMNSDADEFKNNVDKFTLEEITIGVCGEKYKLKLQDKCFFKKQFVNGDGYLAEQALSSAFISCFSHTPYPVGKTYDDKGRSFLVWRYDDCQKKDNDNNEYNIFFNYNYIEDEYKNDKKLKEQFYKMDKKMQKYAIMLHIHQFFFNLYDRKPENLILTNNKLIHIDLDRCFFFFFLDGSTFKYKDKFCNLYDSLSTNNKNLIKWKDETIRKINNIDYNIFIKRYIRNCIVFNIPCEIALSKLKKFIEKMKKFNDENYILNQKSNNQWLLSLQKACKEFYSSFLKNAVIANISSGNFDEEFKALFQQAQNGNVILEKQQSEEKDISSEQDNNINGNINEISNEQDNNNTNKINNNKDTDDVLDNSKKSIKTEQENQHISIKSKEQTQKQQDANKVNQPTDKFADNNGKKNINNKQYLIVEHEREKVGQKHEPILENSNEVQQINNNKAKSGCWCQGCSCNIWPFN